MYRRGDILIVQAVIDPQGGNPKVRPCLVIDGDELPIFAVALTTAFQSGDDFQVELPWARPRHPRTGLWEKCAVACDWFVQLDDAEVLEKLGHCPGKQLLEVMNWIDQLP